MSETSAIGLLEPDNRRQWIRLRTLTWLRWVAVAGQIAALAVAWFHFSFRPPVGPVFAIIGAAIIANLIATFIFPPNKRLSEAGATQALLFDLLQLALLLFVTGGLNNPFALLVLTPVVISATALGRGSTLMLAITAAVLVSVLAFVHLPLIDAAGVAHTLPDTFRFGFWVAIVIGVAFLSLYAGRVTHEINTMSDALLATQMALAREQKLTDLGGVVAAYAHELGTPLATITLVSSELADELGNQPDLHDDVRLIRQQADRCRDILQSMGRAGKDDRLMHSAPLSAVVTEAAEPHQDRGKAVVFENAPDSQRHPQIHRRPEIIHGLRNLIQNAVDFAETTVWIEMQTTDDQIGVRIMDDGPGFSPQVHERIGDPFMHKRSTQQSRPGYHGMGLGLFIAKTLLERTGAELSFANGRDPQRANGPTAARHGAVVEVIWPRQALQSQAPITARNDPVL